MRMAAYCRVSTEKEEQLSSLKNQQEFFEQYAEKCGDTLIKIYADEGISGKSMKKRDAFMKLLRDSAKGLFDYVAVKDISRFARNTSDFLYGIRTLKNNGVDVRFLSGNQTVIGESEFVLTVFAALAQEESANLSKRVIFGKRQNAKKGRVPNMIYGYDRVDTYTLKINEQESEIVKLMFKWYLEGLGTRRICIKLNDMGIPTKLGAKWISRTVRRILMNPIYAGRLVNNKTVTKDFLSGTREDIPEEEWYVHERPELRLVSDEDFELVQKRLEERREQYQMPVGRHSSKHIFSNLIRCGECGKAFTAKVYHWKNTYVKYRCCVHNNNGNAHCTNAVTIDEQELLGEVKQYLLSIIEDKEAFTKRLTEQYVEENKDIDMPRLTKARKKLTERRKKLKEMYINGLIEMSELKEEYASIDSGIKSIDDELGAYNDTLEKIEHVDEIALNIEHLLMQNEFSNEDMKEIIEKILVYPDKSVEIFMK